MLTASPIEIRRGTSFHVEQRARREPPEAQRWICVGNLSGGEGGRAGHYPDRINRYWNWFLTWRGRTMWCQPVFFQWWNEIEKVVRRRLEMAGLELVALACGVKSTWLARGRRSFDVMALVSRSRQLKPRENLFQSRAGRGALRRGMAEMMMEDFDE